MSDRAELLRAIETLKRQTRRFGESIVSTAVTVLEERLDSFQSNPPPLSSLASDQQGSIEQRKQVTILFAAIDGFTRLTGSSHNTEQLRRINQLWQRLDETIREHGGLVDKHMGDVVMGFFGVPLAREDDPERAVYCAMALQEVVDTFLADERDLSGAVRQEPQPVVRIGINTGSVVLGRVGSDSDYTVIGDTVNVASRLREAAAEGGVYISQDTYRLVEPLFRVVPLGDVKIKGRQTPVAVFRVIGQRSRLFFPSAEFVKGITVPMIGRDSEIRQLWTAYETIFRTGQGCVVTIVGDAGVGKSRLMGEFHRLLETVPEKLAIFSGRTDQRRMQDPLSLVQNTLANQLELTVSDRNTTVPEKVFAGLESVVGDRAVQSQVGRELTQVIARLVGFDLPGSLSTSAGIPDADERVRVFDLLLAYFQAIAGRSAGTIIFLEDIHWADDDSLDFFEQIGALAALMPFMVIATTRPQLFERRARWPGDLGGSVEQLTLSPLSDSDSRALVLHLLQKLPSKTPAMVDVIVRSAGGNPFYIEELIKVLIEDGILLPGDPIWRMRPLDLWRMRVPATLTTVLQTRLDRLPESERVTLQQAAVLGDEFWDKAVRQINQASRWSLSDEQLDAALQSLEERGLIARVPSRLSTGSQAFRFRHAMLREVTYENVLLRDRPGYHLQAARWLEAQSGDRLAEHVTLIAQHYESAGQFSTAVRMYQLAAARAADLSQTDNAISHYRHALVLLNHLPHELDVRVDIMSRLGMLLRRDGRFVEALKIFYDMSRTAELDGNLLRQAQAENAQATIYAEMGETGQAMTAAITAERVARLTDAELEFIQALRLQAGFLIDMERFDDALVTISEATDRSRLLDAPRELAGSLVLLNALYRRTGETDKATRVIAELSALAGTLETKGAMAEAGFVLGRLAELVANDELYSDARSILARALDLQRPAADRSEVAESLRQLGLAVGRGGDPAQAVAYLDEATTMAETDGNRYLRLVCRLAMGEMLLAWGRYEAAEATLRQVIAAAEDPERIGHWRRTRDARRLLAEALARQGRRDEAKWVTDNARLSEHGR